jgi:hypothetical protein
MGTPFGRDRRGLGAAFTTTTSAGRRRDQYCRRGLVFELKRRTENAQHYLDNFLCQL